MWGKRDIMPRPVINIHDIPLCHITLAVSELLNCLKHFLFLSPDLKLLCHSYLEMI